MLPEVSLDNMEFNDIVKKARSEIAGICPEWTDYNYHDPGITMIELFSFMKEVQQFYMDQSWDSVKLKYIELLGDEVRGRKSSSTTAEVKISNEGFEEGIFTLPKGSTFILNETSFETEEKIFIPESRIKALISKGGFDKKVLQGEQLSSESGYKFYPFGKMRNNRNDLYICLDRPLKKETPVNMAVYIADDWEIKRNPCDRNRKDLYPSISLSFYKGGRYIDAEILKDETFGFLESGFITFSLNDDMEEKEEDGTRGYFLKISLDDEFLDVPPSVSKLSFCHVPLVQKKTISTFCPVSELSLWENTGKADYYSFKDGFYEEADKENADFAAFIKDDKIKSTVLGTGSGFPEQIFPLECKGVLSSSVEILTRDIEKPERFIKWEKVKDFDSSSPSDYHFIVDEKSDSIVFGNGVRGFMPETEIRLVSLSLTDDERGNVTRGKALESAEYKDVITAFAFKDGTGGRKQETIDEALTRINKKEESLKRAISSEDYEKSVMACPGLRIEDCKVLPFEKGQFSEHDNDINIVVRPFGETGFGKLTDRYKKNIISYLNDKRMLGSAVHIFAPEYIEAEVYAEISIFNKYETVKKHVEDKIEGYFKSLKGFGSEVSYSELYGIINEMEEVREIHMLFINARGNRIERNRSGDVIIPPMGIAVLKKVECVVINS